MLHFSGAQDCLLCSVPYICLKILTDTDTDMGLKTFTKTDTDTAYQAYQIGIDIGYWFNTRKVVCRVIFKSNPTTVEVELGF